MSERDVDVLAMFLDLEHRTSISYVTFNHLLSRAQVIDAARGAKVSHIAYLRGVVAFVEHLDELHQRALQEVYAREALGRPLEAEFDDFCDVVRKVAPLAEVGLVTRMYSVAIVEANRECL